MHGKKALITGVTGQDGSYLAELLIKKGYEVHGTMRRSSSFNTQRIEHLYQDPNSPQARFFVHYADLSDYGTIAKLVQSIRPDEIYHLAAQSHVGTSFQLPEYTGDITALGTVRLLEAVRQSGMTTRFYQASSSEMFGLAPEVPQSECTAFYPRSPYAVAKVFAYWATVNYREAYHLFAANGILFNHESPRRGETFVTRKITRGIARILSGKETVIRLGNLDGKRDWGYAPDYVDAMWRILQQDTPRDFVVATEESHTVREFLDEAFGLVGITDWQPYVIVDPKLLRPSETGELRGDAARARAALGWEPRVKFKHLVRIMVASDLAASGLDTDKFGLTESVEHGVPQLAGTWGY